MEENQFNAKPEAMAQQLSSSIPKNLQEAFARVVQAGMKVMFSEQTHDMLIEQLNKEGDIAQNIGEGIAGLMTLLYQKSNQTMPPEVIVPAGTYLMFQGADFIEKVTKQDITPKIMADAMSTMIDILMEKFGIQKDKFNSAMEKAASGGYNE